MYLYKNMLQVKIFHIALVQKVINQQMLCII